MVSCRFPFLHFPLPLLVLRKPACQIFAGLKFSTFVNGRCQVFSGPIIIGSSNILLRKTVPNELNCKDMYASDTSDKNSGTTYSDPIHGNL